MRSALRSVLFPLLVCAGLVSNGIAKEPEPAKLAASVDAYIAAKWKLNKATPAPIADDATYIRRIYLDLIGRIPTTAEVRGFLEDKSTDKRAKLAERLIDSAAHARHLATLWRREWIPQADTPQFSNLAEDFETWLAAEFRKGTGFNNIARKLLTANRNSEKSVPTTFLTAGEYKPENLAANTTRAFLGINLDCAQCHDHPFARWTREQFWETAAFFARPTLIDKKITFEMPLPGGKKTVGPKLLEETELKWPDTRTDDSARTLLADWVSAKQNPYFARNIVNRAWAQMFGLGLVEPLDDLSGQNPASHPELLDELAKAFADSGFDRKFLYTALVRTQVYQLSSVGTSTNPRLYARAAVRGLTGEQLYDSLRVASGLPPIREDLDPLQANRERRKVAEQFRVDRPGLAQRSILQSLSLMNNTRTAEFTDPATTPTLKAVAEAPFLDARGKVEALFLAAYARKPTADELKLLKADDAASLADLFWALLNSAEFHTNH
jgi:Protein of unknown function (DUF1549)/Protein of unknown function (DUF1553)